MKRHVLAISISYVVTLVILACFTFLQNGGDTVGPVYLWQEITVPDHEAGAFGKTDGDLPFFWMEIVASKQTYSRIASRTDYIPAYNLTTDLGRFNRFADGLFVAVWDYDHGLTGRRLNEKLEKFLPIARDEIISALRERGVQAEPTGEIHTSDDRRYDVYAILPALSAICLPAYAITAFVFCRRRMTPNQPPQRNAGSRPSSDDSPASETPSSPGPRG